jgi:ubiquinone/menaquinone biosynthesis C-methylase UbiE
VQFEPGDLTQLAFPDDSFGAVFVHGVIECLDGERAFSEIHRVLKPGGYDLLSRLPFGSVPLASSKEVQFTSSRS